MNTVFIYSLATKEEPDNIKYIGKADVINERFTRHLQPYYLKEKSHKNNWLKKELKQGNNPIIEFIDEVPKSEWGYWEKFWINQFKQWGFKLTNLSDGGEGIGLTKEIINKRNLSNFLRITKKFEKEIKEFNIKQTKDFWTAIRICPKCNKPILYNAKTISSVIKKVKRGIIKKQTCLSCRDCFSNFKNYFQQTTQEQRKNIAKNAAPKKRVLMLNNNNKILKTFESIRDAERHTKISRHTISGSCNKKPH